MEKLHSLAKMPQSEHRAKGERDSWAASSPSRMRRRFHGRENDTAEQKNILKNEQLVRQLPKKESKTSDAGWDRVKVDLTKKTQQGGISLKKQKREKGKRVPLRSRGPVKI